jgi:hypothetical protein
MRGLSSKPYRTGAIGGIPRSRERGVALLVMALLMVIGLPIMGLMKGMEHRHNPAVIQHSLGYQLLDFSSAAQRPLLLFPFA